ncbi:amino acid permease [Legionella jordanis]|uniref:Amino acid (Lysine) permease n=1 Tax=Legionella jordanis TaxID=456 RepID=A0A0W0VBH1_9GAMM|nr:amino acid permease [Legionella jordanis]KTD17432.1 amino acid (lysine) permease [Legionella jordanis]RMX01804.1 amino acid permease [Legionella jordanis]RMX15468.1 amino acid permease [Legionella jordanis]VEH11546.1 amino acid (lysine) permease [Legionella jordanis]HAT8714621.1 amino acid permease [Legionella jordanis]
MQSRPREQVHSLQRKLNARMLSMITLGGSIGTGIFLGSGNALSIAGPGGAVVAYCIMGFLIYYLMMGLGEMAAFMPTTGSFAVYAARFVDPSLGYALAWNYWYGWAITIASEISASSLIMHYWFPASPSFLWCAVFLILIFAFNMISTRVFGEIEYWLSFLKVAVIILFLVIGISLICGFNQLQAVGWQYWSINDAPFHNGWWGVMGAFVVAGFSFQGTELLGIAAGETSQPAENISKAVKLVFWRILLFFILSIVVISLLIPYTSDQLKNSTLMMSPFTMVFSQWNKIMAAAFMNAVILVAILSTANAGLFVGSRMLWHMSKENHVPRLFSKLNKRGIPIYALLATASIAALAFLSSFYGDGIVYFWLLSAASLSGFIAWMGIAISHYRFRKAYLYQGKDLSQLPYLAKGYPYGSFFAILLCLLVIVGQNYAVFMADELDWQGLFISYIGLPLFLVIWITNKWLKKTQVTPLAHCNFYLDNQHPAFDEEFHGSRPNS